MIKTEYDIIVVGGGPAGTTAARKAAEQGVSVALFHRNNEIGVPVRCAEGISRKIFEKYIGVENIKESWIASEVDTLRFISPSNFSVDTKVKETGYVLNRRNFDLDLALWATEKGVSIFTGCNVYKVEKKSNYSNVYIDNYGKKHKVKTKLVIAADGVESGIAKFFGIDTTLSKNDIDSCAQVLAMNIEMQSNRVEFWVSPTIAPGGYIWLFPKGENIANIGIGISGNNNANKTAKEYLSEFLKEKFPNASYMTNIAGGVPIAKTLKSFVADGLIIVGDAARVSNPTTGEGIGPALSTGMRAGKVAGKAIIENNVSEKYLKSYEKEWRKESGKHHNFYYRLKDVAYGLSDIELDKLAKKFDGRDAESITLTEIFTNVLKKKPKLLLEVIRAFAGL